MKPMSTSNDTMVENDSFLQLIKVNIILCLHACIVY